MPFDRRINPLTHDYIDTGLGSLETIETIETSLYMQFTITLNRWWGRPENGNTIHELQELGIVGDIDQETIDRLLFALKPLLDSGRASDPVFQLDVDKTGKLVVVSSIRDVQKGERVTTQLPVGV